MIELKNLRKTYTLGTNVVNALDDVSLTINDGEFVAIMGPSGSGKSTLMNMIGLLDTPDSGKYVLNGKEISETKEDDLAELRRNTIGFIFQQFNLLSRLDARSNVQLPLVYSGHLENKDNADLLLDRVGIGKRKWHKPSELSGGQQQRVAIARALINNPSLILADEPTGNLDSASEKEIMTLLRELNDAGMTVVIVTHNDEIGEQAKRVVRMRDGKVVSDTVNIPSDVRENNFQDNNNQKGKSAFIFELKEHLKQGMQSILSNKIRAFLSMLGILIGVGAVVAMLALGNGAKIALKEQIESMGANLLMVMPGAFRMGGVTMEEGSVTRLNVSDVEALKKSITEVNNASPTIRGSSQVVYLNKNKRTNITGTSIAYEQIRASSPTMGRFFTLEEQDRRASVALLGTTVIRELFGTKNPIGQSIKIDKINFKVIGVLPKKGVAGPRDQDDIVIIPYTTAMKKMYGKTYIDAIDVELSKNADTKAAEESIKEFLFSRHNVALSQREDAFRVMNMAEMQKMMSQMSNVMSMLLASIAGISLLVGGIGIMNIMLVSVTERTREIGIRKAIGAKKRDILMQFLTESFVISFVGGVFGVFLGWSASVILSKFAGWTTVVSVMSIVLALGFSLGIGLFFGVYPALKAAKLKPIVALRYE